MTRPSIALAAHLPEIRSILERAGMRNARLFGSAARGDDTDHSDLDIIVDPPADTSLYDLADVELAIEKLIGHPVEIMTPGLLATDVNARAERDMIPLDTLMALHE
jgi:uncharacterized protein